MGNVNSGHLDILQSHDCFYNSVKPEHIDFYKEAAHLYSTNEQVDERNRKKVREI